MVGDWNARGFLMPLEYYDNTMVFPPKGKEENYNSEVLREPECTRPLSLKSSDNKISGGVVNLKIRHIAAAHVPKIQRGFAAGRQLIDNIVDLRRLRCSQIRYSSTSKEHAHPCRLGCPGCVPVAPAPLALDCSHSNTHSSWFI